MKKLLLTSLVSSFILVGCGGSMPPKCDSNDTKKLLKQVIQQKINSNIYLKNQVSKFSTTGHEMIEEYKNAHEYSCEARAIYTYKNGSQNSELISYSVFLNLEKKGQYFVQINQVE